MLFLEEDVGLFMLFLEEDIGVFMLFLDTDEDDKIKMDLFQVEQTSTELRLE